MFSLKEILEELPLPREVKKGMVALEIAKKYWKDVLPKELSEKTNPLSYDSGTLIVEVANHYYLQVLSLKILEILEKLESFSPSEFKPLFKNLKFIINPSLEKSQRAKWTP